MKLGSIPAHLPLDRPVRQPREAVASRRTVPRGVDCRPRGDVAVAERHDDVWSEVAAFDGRATRQRRRNVLSQSQFVAVGRLASVAVVDLIQPLDTLRRHYNIVVIIIIIIADTLNSNDIHSVCLYMYICFPIAVN